MAYLLIGLPLGRLATIVIMTHKTYTHSKVVDRHLANDTAVLF